MDALEFLNKVETNYANIEEIRSKLLKAEKRQLIACNEHVIGWDNEGKPSEFSYSVAKGYNIPNAYGVYREGGGLPLGVVGEGFVPANLEYFLDSVVQSIVNSGKDLDLSELTYHEYNGGRRIAFRIPLKDFFIGEPKKGDVTKLALSFRTGFDGKTKNTIHGDAYRIWCDNGCGAWNSELSIGFKNTKTAEVKRTLFVNEVINQVDMLENYQQFLNSLTEIEITQEQIDNFLSDLLGEPLDDIRKSKLKNNRLIKIENAIQTEVDNTDMTLFSLLQGITRHTTHNVARGDYNQIHFNGTASRMNDRAHELINAMAVAN